MNTQNAFSAPNAKAVSLEVQMSTQNAFGAEVSAELLSPV